MGGGDREPDSLSVTWEDQKRICTFGRLNTRAGELTAEVEEKKQEIEKLTDAESEIYIADDTQLVLGECFVRVDADVLEELLVKKKESLESQVEELQSELGSIQKVMQELKAQLYAKFGKSIYLENE